MNQTYTLQGDAPEDYAALVRLAGSSCAFFLLVVRKLSGAEPELKAVLTELKEHLRASSERSEWPGTRLLGHTATVFTYHLDECSADKLLNFSSRFCEWLTPERPEDLAFLRSDESVWLGSIAHEQDVFLKLSDAEFLEIRARQPSLAQHLVKDSVDAS